MTFKKQLDMFQKWERRTSGPYIVTLFNLYAEYVMQNPGLDKAKAGMKIARKNTNNLKYADDNTFMTECKEKLKSLLVNVKKLT